MIVPKRPQDRRGAIAPLTALLLVFLLAMVAFAVDLAWVVEVRTELQNAADASALAGANELMEPYVRWQLPNQTSDSKQTILNLAMASARTTAKNYAKYNRAGNVAALTLRDEDIQFGFTDGAGNYQALGSPTQTNGSLPPGYPNTIRITLRRDKLANGALPLFFGAVLGKPSSDLSAPASATIYSGVVDSFTPGAQVTMLPMTYDVNDWKSFLQTGKDPDGKKYTDDAGLPTLPVYPTIKDRGNFGELALDGVHAGSSEIRSWIDSGLTPADVGHIKDLGLIPLSGHDPNKWDWIGNPGLRTSTIQAANELVGKTFMLPLFKASNNDPKNYQAGVGEGSNYYFNIVQFVGVRVMPPWRANKTIVVQPAAFVDADDVYLPGSVVPAGTDGTFVTTFAVPKLTR